MFRFIESIKLNNGKVYHLDWHQKRVNETFAIYFENSEPLDLKSVIATQSMSNTGLYKIRIVYDATNFDLTIEPYKIRTIESFELVEIGFDYPFKFEDREEINLYKNVSSRDEVIFTKNNLILDASYANLAFLKNEQWYTPNSYLLNGTTRQRLIADNQLIETEITQEDLRKYSHVSFINALNDLGENVLQLNHCFI